MSTFGANKYKLSYFDQLSKFLVRTHLSANTILNGEFLFKLLCIVLKKGITSLYRSQISAANFHFGNSIYVIVNLENQGV